MECAARTLLIEHSLVSANAELQERNGRDLNPRTPEGLLFSRQVH